MKRADGKTDDGGGNHGNCGADIGNGLKNAGDNRQRNGKRDCQGEEAGVSGGADNDAEENLAADPAAEAILDFNQQIFDFGFAVAKKDI